MVYRTIPIRKYSSFLAERIRATLHAVINLAESLKVSQGYSELHC